ncbi:MAG: N-acetyltransferase [Anaerolineaceae bacterium]|nr:N-acetyltransferase [Anaerolineaceae bacterium]
MATFIHPSADVDDDVIIGEDTKIWHLSYIRKHASLGDECILGRGVFVDEGVQIGSRVKIQNYVSVYAGVTIEDGVFVGPHVCFTNDYMPRAVNPDMTLKSADDWVITPTLVKAGAAIGANSTIVCGKTIGQWALVGSGSVVTRDVPDHALVVGNPAHQIGWVCSCGKRVNSREEVDECMVNNHAQTSE